MSALRDTGWAKALAGRLAATNVTPNRISAASIVAAALAGAAFWLSGAAQGFVRPSLRVRLVIPLTLLAFVPLLVFLGQPQLVLACVLLALAGLGHASSLGIDQLLVEAIPEEIRGRGFTVATAGMMLSQGLGFAAAGILGQLIGETRAIVVAGVVGIVVVAVLGRLLQREQRRAPALAG